MWNIKNQYWIIEERDSHHRHYYYTWIRFDRIFSTVAAQQNNRKICEVHIMRNAFIVASFFVRSRAIFYLLSVVYLCVLISFVYVHFQLLCIVHCASSEFSQRQLAFCCRNSHHDNNWNVLHNRIFFFPIFVSIQSISSTFVVNDSSIPQTSNKSLYCNESAIIIIIIHRMNRNVLKS